MNRKETEKYALILWEWGYTETFILALLRMSQQRYRNMLYIHRRNLVRLGWLKKGKHTMTYQHV